MEIQKYRTFSYEVSEAIAPSWESRSAEIEALVKPVRDWMIQALDPKPGDKVLELAAGTGDTGFRVARMIGDEGRLISSDFSPKMLETAKRRGAELGIENVDYRVIDAERIELEDDSVDAVLCRYGYMLMPDPAAALAETRRVLCPGGRVALAVWADPQRNPFFSVTAINLVQRGHMPPPDPHGPGIFSMASEERTRSLLEGAGFEEIRIEEIPTRFTFADIDEYMSFLADTAGPVAMTLRQLPDEERQQIKSEVAEAFSSFAENGGYSLPAVTLAAVAS